MKYNKLQQEAIDSKAPKVLVVAPAGSGKTSSLVGAIKKYAEDNPTAKIVAITFTKKAALELQSRLFGLKVECATIHSWSLKELNRLGAKHKFRVSILQDSQIQEILKDLSRKCGYYSINMFMLFSYIMGNYNIDVTQGTKMKFEKVMRAYKVYKRENKLYDFTDLPQYLYDMLEKFNEHIEHIDGLFVDEFQDVDDIQEQIFRAVDAEKYFYIGDPRQSIYLFRGATPEVLKKLDDFEKHELLINYRSYQSIIDYADSACKLDRQLSRVSRIHDSKVRCARDDEDGSVYLVDEDGIGYDVVNQTYCDNTYDLLSMFLLKKPYILCRSNKQVKAIESMGYRHVSTVHQAKGLEYNNVIVLDMELTTEEEVNIAYVACTRAQNGLLICDENIFNNMFESIIIEHRDELIGGKLF